MVTEVLGGGKFYVQTVGDKNIASIQQQLASLNLQEAPVIGAFNPKKGDIVLAQFSADNSWNRAMVSFEMIPSSSLFPKLVTCNFVLLSKLLSLGVAALFFPFFYPLMCCDKKLLSYNRLHPVPLYNYAFISSSL